MMKDKDDEEDDEDEDEKSESTKGPTFSRKLLNISNQRTKKL